MEEILKSIGWNEMFPETIKRLAYFKDAFREYYPQDIISDKELEKCVAYSFGIYGQEHVYDIYSIATNELKNKSETLPHVFGEFIKAFEVLPKETYESISPRHYISLFIEYIFSVFIKR